MISYDYDKPLEEMRWFKVANIPDVRSKTFYKKILMTIECKHAGDMVPEKGSQYEMNRVSVTLPKWLKSGKAVL